MDEKEKYIACCGFHCKTCKAYRDKSCTGCKIGYENGSKNISLAKCSIKRCCLLDKKVTTCAECDEYRECRILASKLRAGSYQYKKCMEFLNFIDKHGEQAFTNAAKDWKNSYGKVVKE